MFLYNETHPFPGHTPTPAIPDNVHELGIIHIEAQKHGVYITNKYKKNKDKSVHQFLQMLRGNATTNQCAIGEYI